MYVRQLSLNAPKGQSLFLWGARQTGKSAYLRKNFPDGIFYDLLNTHEFIRLSKNPHLLYEEVSALDDEQRQKPIIIDEIQKVPELLNEVHALIENIGAHFILCGSSARQLKTQATNLLGGRAWKYHFCPLIVNEIPDFDLLKALQHGLVPKHYDSEPKFIDDYLQAYVEVYLTDEIRNEGLVRNLRGFAKFLDVVGLTNGEMVNVNNIARDCAIDRTTVQSYYQILVDTLLGYNIYPYNVKKKRDLIVAEPKFYLFDVGVANFLANEKVTQLKGSTAGKSFEHFILMELIAYISYTRQRINLWYWRTKTGLEVDFILGDAKVAIEVKISESVKTSDLKGLISFKEEHPQAKAVVVSQDKRKRILKLSNDSEITVYPWGQFIKALWANDIYKNG